MRIVVSGGTGFIGRALVARLMDDGHEVVVLTRDPDKARARLPGGVAAKRFDATSLPGENFVEGAGAVITLAGESIAGRWTPERKERMTRSRIEGTRTLAQQAATSGTVEVFLAASATGYYGLRDEAELTEESPAGDDFLAELCRRWEEAATPARGAGVRVAHVRIGTVLHPDGGLVGGVLPMFKLGLGGVIGSGEQAMSWIHRDDLIALFVHLLGRADLSGPFNATTPFPATNREFTKAMGRVLHRPTMLRVPAFALKLMLGDLATYGLRSQRVLPKRTLASGFAFAHPQIEEAVRSMIRE